MSFETYDHYIYAALALLGTLAAALGVLLGVRQSPWVASLQGVAPPFINVVGVLFGLTLAFIANDTWSAHERAITAVYREADAIKSLVVLSRNLPAEEGARLRESIAVYAGGLDAEWGALAKRRLDVSVSARGDALLQQLAAPSLGRRVGDPVQALLLGKAAELRAERDVRIALSQTHINPLKWLGMALLGFLTLLAIAVVHVDKPRAATVAVILFALSAGPTAAIVLVQGNPFLQPSSVTPAPIRAALATVAPP